MIDRESALSRALAALTEDLLFATVSADSADPEGWREVVKRRADTYAALLKGQPVHGPSQLDAWVLTLVRAMVPHQAPSWMPMRELVDGGVTMLGGARGVRSLFSSKMSDKDVQRVRRLSVLAVRVAVSVMGADGPLSRDETRLKHALIASFGVSAEDEATLAAIAPVDPSTIESSPDVEPKIAKQLCGGAWQAALQDGLDARDEGYVAAACNRLGLLMGDVGNVGVEVKKEGEWRRTLTAAATEGTVYLLADDPERAKELLPIVIELGCPAPHRAELYRLTTPAGPPALTGRNLDKGQRQAALALAWLAALHANPHYVRRAALAARHDKLAAQLAGESDGLKVRQATESFLDEQLSILNGVLDQMR